MWVWVGGGGGGGLVQETQNISRAVLDLKKQCVKVN